MLGADGRVFLRPERQRISIAEPQPPPPTQFFAERNEVPLTVPWEMRAIDLIRLYQLEGSREENLRRLQLDEESVLEQGRSIQVILTPRDDGDGRDESRERE